MMNVMFLLEMMFLLGRRMQCFVIGLGLAFSGWRAVEISSYSSAPVSYVLGWATILQEVVIGIRLSGVAVRVFMLESDS
jgi:hypothetical protein